MPLSNKEKLNNYQKIQKEDPEKMEDNVLVRNKENKRKEMENKITKEYFAIDRNEEKDLKHLERKMEKEMSRLAVKKEKYIKDLERNLEKDVQVLRKKTENLQKKIANDMEKEEKSLEKINGLAIREIKNRVKKEKLLLMKENKEHIKRVEATLAGKRLEKKNSINGTIGQGYDKLNLKKKFMNDKFKEPKSAELKIKEAITNANVSRSKDAMLRCQPLYDDQTGRTEDHEYGIHAEAELDGRSTPDAVSSESAINEVAIDDHAASLVSEPITAVYDHASLVSEPITAVYDQADFDSEPMMAVYDNASPESKPMTADEQLNRPPVTVSPVLGETSKLPITDVVLANKPSCPNGSPTHPAVVVVAADGPGCDTAAGDNDASSQVNGGKKKCRKDNKTRQRLWRKKMRRLQETEGRVED